MEDKKDKIINVGEGKIGRGNIISFMCYHCRQISIFYFAPS